MDLTDCVLCVNLSAFVLRLICAELYIWIGYIWTVNKFKAKMKTLVGILEGRSGYGKLTIFFLPNWTDKNIYKKMMLLNDNIIKSNRTHDVSSCENKVSFC